MRNTIEKVGRLSIAEVTNRRVFVSFVVCKNQQGQHIILGTGSPYLLTLRQRHLQVVQNVKVPLFKAVIKARKRGELTPRQSDMFTSRPVSLQLVDYANLDRNTPLEVYNYTI